MDETHYPKGGNAGSKGVDFQISLLTMFFLNALQKKEINNWKLSTENELAGKFDDIVLQWSEGAVLLQAKHKEKVTKITLEEFLSTNSRKDNFSLPKYFLSYQDIKNKFNVINLVICTNAEVDDKILELESQTTCDESVLYCPDNQLSFFTFNTDILPRLKQAVIKYFENNCKDKNINQSIITDKNLEDFLEHLQIHASFPAGNDLKDIIEKSLLVLKCSNELYEINYSLEIQSKVKDWFQQKKGFYWTENNAKAMFSEIRTDKYYQKLSQYNVTFQRKSLYLQFLNSKRIYYIIANYGCLLQEIKIYCTLTKLKAKTLCISGDQELAVQKQIIEAFKLSLYTFLVILWPDESLFTEINEKLSVTLERFDNKKIIIAIESSKKIIELNVLDRRDYEHISETVTFDDLSDETQDRLLRKNNIIFQGIHINLGELFSILEVADLEKAANLFIHKLVGEEKIKVGAELIELDEAHLYICRTFKKEMETTDTTVFSEENIYKVDEKIVVIADAAGMGKTTVLTNLAAIIKQRDSRKWVIQIKLNDFSTILKDFVKANRRTINIMDLLNSHDATKMNDFEKYVFAMTKKVVLMLDGVDEISPDYTHLIIDLLQQCQEASNFAKVFVTTRSYMAHELESKLHVTWFTLEPFTEENEIHFLTRYWMHYLSLTEDIDKRKCEKYAKALLNKMLLTDANSGTEDHFAAIPLQLKMLAEVFQKNKGSDGFFDWQGCKEYLHADEEEPKLPEKMNLVTLYDMFIEKKRDIFIDRENPCGLPAATYALTHQFYENLDFYRIIALESIVGERGRVLFSCYDKNNNDMKTIALRIGIVQQSKEALNFIYNDDNSGIMDPKEFNFVHRMMAEYFVAESIVRELQCQNQNVEFQRFLIEEVFYTHTFNSVVTFFDNFLQKNPDVFPPTIFQSYQSISYEVRLIWKYNLDLIHRLAKKGYIEVLHLLLECTDFTITKNKEAFISSIYDVGVRRNIEKRNTLNCLQFFLKQGGLNIKDNLDRTPLHFAASRGHLKMVIFLVERGANVNSKSYKCCSPIVEAVQNGHIDVTKYLLAQTLNSQSVESMNENNFDVTMFYLENMLKHNQLDTKNTIVPYVAACMGYLSLLKGLIEQGINANSIFENGETLIFGAARGGQLHIIRYLAYKGANINNKDHMGRTVLHLTSRKPYCVQTAKLFIELGINIDIRDDLGQTALYMAAFHGILDMVELLVTSGANVNSRDNFGNTVLSAAVSGGSFDCVIFLVRNGAGVDVEDNDGNTLIHSAASRQQLIILKYLVACNVDVNVGNNCGQTALHAAAFAADEDTVEFLVNLGMDVNTTDGKGRTALHVAVEMFLNNIEHIIDVDLLTTYENIYLRRYSVFHKERTVLHLAAEKGQLNTIEFLIENGANVNANDKKGHTPLHLAAKGGNAAVVKLLIDQGANVGSRDYKGNTPADLANKAEHLHLDQYLKANNVRSRCIRILSVGCLT